MAKPQRKIDKTTLRRLRTAYVSTIASISLVLLMIGILGLVLLYASKISDYVKENIGFSIIMHEEAKEFDIINFQKSIDASGYVKSTRYISKEQAAKDLEKDLGNDFLKFLGYNPLLPSIEVFLKADYANNDSIVLIEKKIMANPNVGEVVYVKSLIEQVNNNIKKISLVLMVITVVLLLIAITLINNTIRLSVFSKRFLIKSMQLIGATEGFIRKPFIIKGVIQGLIGSFITVLALIGIIYLGQKHIPELVDLHDVDMFLALFGVVFVFGILLAWVCNYFAVRKFLKIKTDYLYYY